MRAFLDVQLHFSLLYFVQNLQSIASGYESCPTPAPTTIGGKSGKSTKSAKSSTSPTLSASPSSSPGSKSAKSSSLGQSGKSNKNGGLQVTGASGTVEEFAAEVEEAVENAVKMVNIEQFNLYQGSVNVYKYADANGETEVVETVPTGLRGVEKGH